MLNLDVSPDHARALHRVVRAMHDGNCPKCGHLGPSPTFEHLEIGPLTPENIGQSTATKCHRCPKCKFTITEAEALAAMQAFRPYMLANLEVFESWRATV